VKDGTTVSVDIHSMTDADDVMVRMEVISGLKINFFHLQIEFEVFTKVDGTFNPVIKPDPAHICKLHEVRP
jgi:hypothetical protein